MVAAIVLAFLCMFLKEGVGSTASENAGSDEELKNFKVNPIMALIPVVPLFLLVAASKQVGWLPTKTFSVAVCMLIGTALGIIVALVRKQSW